MSAKIRLFKKINESKSLNEGTPDQQPAAQPAANAPANGQTAAPAAQPVANAPAAAPATGQQNTAAPATNNNQVQGNGQTNQNANAQNDQQQQTIDQQLQAVLVKHFGGLQQNISKDLANIKDVKWAAIVQPKDQSFNSVMEALQNYVKQNIEAAKAAVQQNQNQGQNQQQNNNQQQNTSTNQ